MGRSRKDRRAGDATNQMSVEEVLTAFHADLQGNRVNIMAKNLTLTAEQAAKFWPMFEQYQKEQNVIMDAQLKDVEQYVSNHQNLDDSTALLLMNAHFDRDTA
jgi:Spy/CpxP family protein refolding chaperone